MRHSEIRERITKGVGAQGFDQGFYILMRLVEVPLFLHYWGTQLYGEWLILSTIPAYLSISDAGFVNAARREMAIMSSAGNKKGAVTVFQSIWMFLVFISIVVALLAISCSLMLPLSKILNISTIKEVEVKAVFLLLVAYILVCFQGGLINGAFWITKNYATGMYYLLLAQVLEFLGLILPVCLGGGPVLAATGYLIGRSLGIIIMFYGLRKVSPYLNYNFSNANFYEIKRISIPAFSSLAFPLGNTLNIQGLRIVIGLTLGPSMLAIFSTMRTLSRLVIQPAGIINRLIEPELSIAFGSSNKTLFRKLYLKACQLSFWGAVMICLAAIPITYFIFPIWTAGHVKIIWPVYFLLLTGTLSNCLWNTSLIVSSSVNRHTAIAPYFIFIYGVLTLLLCYPFLILFNISGAAIAIIVTESLMAIIIIIISARMGLINAKIFLKNIFKPPSDILNFNNFHFK